MMLLSGYEPGKTHICVPIWNTSNTQLQSIPSDCIHLLCIVYLVYFVKCETYFLRCSVFRKANQFCSVSH